MKIAWVLSAVVALAACETKDAPTPPKGTATATAAAQVGPKVRFDRAPDGEVAPLVARAVEQGRAEHRRVLVYVGATWCEPCRLFHRAVERGDLDAVLGPLTLVEFDLDRDADRLHAAGYRSEYIPLFAVPLPDGRSSGRQVEGSVKGDGAVLELLPRLHRLLQ